MEKTISRQIAEFAVGLKYEDLPKEVVDQTKRFLYDSIGCAFGSMQTNDVNAIRDIYTEIGGKEQATVFGFGDRMPAIHVSLINSLMIRSADTTSWSMICKYCAHFSLPSGPRRCK